MMTLRALAIKKNRGGSAMRRHIPTKKPESNNSSLLQRRPALQIGVNEDVYEQEADRTADAIINGGAPGLSRSLSKINILSTLQREQGSKPKSEKEKYKEAAKKLGEAFLETEPGKEITEKAKKLGDAFISTLPGKIITGSAITAAVATLAASHKELPIDIPEIPLNKIKPGLKLKITYEGPVDNPTKVMVGFSIPLGVPQTEKKSAITKSEQIRSGTARMAMELHRFREGLTTSEQRTEDERTGSFNAWVMYGSGVGATMIAPRSGSGLPPPLAPYAPAIKITGEQPKTEEPKKKKEESTIQRKSNSVAHESETPAIVNDVLGSPGQPLAAVTRHYMEQRFGHNFSRVRIHQDERAAQSARSVDALAYTAGTHIVFARGEYNPHSRTGQHLLAHELTHVIQQAGAAQTQHILSSPLNSSRIAKHTIQRKPGTGVGERMPTGVRTLTATADDRREFVREAIQFLQGQGEYFARQPDRNLATHLRNLLTTIESGLTVNALIPSSTALETELRDTYREAVRITLMAQTITQPGTLSVRTPPTLQELYERHRDDILPFALPQVSVDPGADELSAELTTPLPDHPTTDQRQRHEAVVTARQQLRVVTSSIDMGIEDLFSTRGGRTIIPLPENTTARFASTIPSTLQPGLQNVAGQLMGAVLTANTTVMLALDLTPFGGSYDAYRFTRLDLGRLGTEVLIERQGAIGIERLRAEQRRQFQQRFNQLGFRHSGFSQEELEQVLIGVSEIPQGQLTSLGNLRFQRRSVDREDPDTAGHYDQTTHTIHIFDRAYSSGSTRLGRTGRVLTFAAHSVVHEIGHALDLSALRTTAAATATAENALLREFGTGDRNFRIPAANAPDRARYNELRRGTREATTSERSARALSGARWNRGDPAEVTDDLIHGAQQPAFRVAATSDGGPTGRRLPTTYPNPESVWQEYFAESFALYQTSPNLLRRMRPNVFRYMEQEFPL